MQNDKLQENLQDNHQDSTQDKLPETKILVIEDDNSFAKLLEIKLRAWNSGLHITRASSLTEGRSILEANTLTPFNLIILDQQLPDGDGVSILNEDIVEHSAVLAISSNTDPQLPANNLKAGARFFLQKKQVSEPLFLPLLEAVLSRQQIETELLKSQLLQNQFETIKTLIATLEHEINNPLGAVFGATYLIQKSLELQGLQPSPEQLKAINLIDESGTRIKEVLDKLKNTASLEVIEKGQQEVFHVPGDDKW